GAERQWARERDERDGVIVTVLPQHPRAVCLASVVSDLAFVLSDEQHLLHDGDRAVAIELGPAIEVGGRRRQHLNDGARVEQYVRFALELEWTTNDRQIRVDVAT